MSAFNLGSHKEQYFSLEQRSGNAAITEAMDILTGAFKVAASVAVRVSRPGRSQAQESCARFPRPWQFSHVLIPSNHSTHFGVRFASRDVGFVYG